MLPTAANVTTATTANHALGDGNATSGESPPERRLVALADAITGPRKKKLFSIVEEPLEKLLSVAALNQRWADADATSAAGTPPFAAILEALAVKTELRDADRARIPATGPVILTANHPFGALDGLILGALTTSVRSDLRLIGDNLWNSVPELLPWLITAPGLGTTRASLAWLRGGGALGVFPAGSVSELQLRAREVVDPPWREGFAALAARTGATVVPVFFEGRNSALFQVTGLVSRGLRATLLAKEVLKRIDTTVRVRIGKPITPDKLASLADAAARTDYLRFKTYALRLRGEPVRPRFRARTVAPAPATQAPLAAPVPPGLLAGEIARLPQETLMLAQGPFEVRVASHEQIPAVMREIGFLREKTFRAVGEGTGQSLDIDRFDESYVHLFMWNKDARELVGSYRLGHADRILARDGKAGLYTSTLFKFKRPFLDRLNPAIELGRSFIRAEYQRKHTSLALIWRGIGEYLVRNPRYKTLFGPVSISREYLGLSRALMVEYLAEHRGDASLAELVRARNPPRGKLRGADRALLSTLANDVDAFSSLISDLEDDDKGLPVLLKHYLKLNARLIGFNVDPAFGDCLDGLIVVDLRTTDPKILKRFMGEDGYAFFAASAPPARA